MDYEDDMDLYLAKFFSLVNIKDIILPDYKNFKQFMTMKRNFNRTSTFEHFCDILQ